MNKIVFEDSEIFFRNFLLGKLSADVEFHGFSGKAIIDRFPAKRYAQVNSSDIIIRFSLKEKSPQFLQLLENPEPVNPSLKHLLSDFGTIKIVSPGGCALKIKDAFWTRYPIPEFQIRHNSENMIHSLYFLW